MRAGKLPVETCLVTTIHDWGVRRSAARNQSKRRWCKMTPPACWPGAEWWWRRRESNPRPQALRSRTYML